MNTRSFKRRVRARMAETGETYTVAMAALRRQEADAKLGVSRSVLRRVAAMTGQEPPDFAPATCGQCGQPGQTGACPFREEIHGDTTPCPKTCCAGCRHECLRDT